MRPSVFVFDSTSQDSQSKVRGIGRYLQLLKENFGNEWIFSSRIENCELKIENSVFINPFFNFLSPPLLMRKIAKKQIAVIHDLLPLKYPEHFPVGLKGKLNIFLNKLSLNQYDNIIAVSETTKKDIIRMLGVPEHRIKVIYSCLPEKFSEENQCLKIGNFCMYVGDATWNKNLVNLAKAIKKANVTCVFVGNVFLSATGGLHDPWKKELYEFMEIAKNDTRFVFPGYISDEELISFYKNAVCNILVSRDEGFGFSYLEASSQKTPSVLSDIQVFYETAENTALFANPHNPQDISDKILTLMSDEKLRNELGNKAYDKTSCYSSQEFRKRFLSIVSDGKIL